MKQLRLVDGSPLDQDYRYRILNHLKSKPNGVTLTELYKICNKHILKEELHRILVELGVVCFKVEGFGRPKVIVRL